MQQQLKVLRLFCLKLERRQDVRKAWRSFKDKKKKSVQKFTAYWLDLSRAAVSFYRCVLEKKKNTIRLVRSFRLKPILMSTNLHTWKISNNQSVKWMFVGRSDMLILFPQHAWMLMACHKYWSVSLSACCGFGGARPHARAPTQQPACTRMFARPCGELALSGDVMAWLACCGTWPRLCCVSSALQGSVIPQPPAHNTHHSIPQTTTEQNSTTPGTMSTLSFRRRKKNQSS